MTCDGDISADELALIKKMVADGVIECDDVEARLEELLAAFNSRRNDFMKDYFAAVEAANPDKEAALKLLRIGVKTVLADEVVEYSEVKFFRAVRSHIHSVTDAEVLADNPEADDFWLEADVKSAGADYLENDYLSAINLPEFDLSVLKNEKLC